MDGESSGGAIIFTKGSQNIKKYTHEKAERIQHIVDNFFTYLQCNFPGVLIDIPLSKVALPWGIRGVR